MKVLCKRTTESFVFLRSVGNRAYPLKLGSSFELHVYCHMTNDLGACGGGGWTMVMKMDGNKVLFFGIKFILITYSKSIDL